MTLCSPPSHPLPPGRESGFFASLRMTNDEELGMTRREGLGFFDKLRMSGKESRFFDKLTMSGKDAAIRSRYRLP
jgi:hypothetical protein